MVTDFFKQLYTKDTCPTYRNMEDYKFSAIHGNMHVTLSKKFTRTEVYQALEEMGPFKAPRPDGFQALFFQRNWNIVGNSVYNTYLQILNEVETTKEINKTVIVLITKVENLERVNQL